MSFEKPGTGQAASGLRCDYSEIWPKLSFSFLSCKGYEQLPFPTYFLLDPFCLHVYIDLVAYGAASRFMDLAALVIDVVVAGFRNVFLEWDEGGRSRGPHHATYR
jgi:hypothetical protein